MRDADDCRKQAEEARQMAAQACKQEDEIHWLYLAEDWLKLAQEADKRMAKEAYCGRKHC